MLCCTYESTLATCRVECKLPCESIESSLLHMFHILLDSCTAPADNGSIYRKPNHPRGRDYPRVSVSPPRPIIRECRVAGATPVGMKEGYYGFRQSRKRCGRTNVTLCRLKGGDSFYGSAGQVPGSIDGPVIGFRPRRFFDSPI
jgi:hypothetical protein